MDAVTGQLFDMFGGRAAAALRNERQPAAAVDMYGEKRWRDRPHNGRASPTHDRGMAEASVGGGGCKWFSKASPSTCDPPTNTYACVRSMNSSRTSERNSVYCEFTVVPSAPNGWSPFYSEYVMVELVLL